MLNEVVLGSGSHPVALMFLRKRKKKAEPHLALSPVGAMNKEAVSTLYASKEPSPEADLVGNPGSGCPAFRPGRDNCVWCKPPGHWCFVADTLAGQGTSKAYVNSQLFQKLTYLAGQIHNYVTSQPPRERAGATASQPSESHRVPGTASVFQKSQRKSLTNVNAQLSLTSVLYQC